MSSSIHPTAIVEEGAVLGENCTIHPYAIVRKYAILGDRVTVHPFAVVGGDPQVLKFDFSTPTYARIGTGTIIHEGVTINRSTEKGGATVVGENCLFMTNSHVAHDCILHNRVVVVNNAMLAGHVVVHDYAVLGGGVGVHQYVRVGEGAILAGLARITRDVAPFTMAAERDETIGLNLIGIKRRGFSREAIVEIKDCFRAVFLKGGSPKAAAAARLGEGVKSDEARRFLEFFSGGKRGFAPARRGVTADSEGEG